MINKEEFIPKMAKNLMEKTIDHDFLEENEGKWVVILKNNETDTDKSLKSLYKKHKKQIVGSFQVHSKDSVMLL